MSGRGQNDREIFSRGLTRISADLRLFAFIRGLFSSVNEAVDDGEVVADVKSMCAAQIFPPLRQNLRNFLLAKLRRRQLDHLVEPHPVTVTSRRVLRRPIEIALPVKQTPRR